MQADGTQVRYEGDLKAPALKAFLLEHAALPAADAAQEREEAEKSEGKSEMGKKAPPSHVKVS